MSGYPDEDPDAAPPRRRADLSLPRKVTMDPMQYYGRCELQARAMIKRNMWWYRDRSGLPRGPMNLDIVKKCWINGIIDENTLVWGNGLGDWVPMRNVRGMAELLHEPKVQFFKWLTQKVAFPKAERRANRQRLFEEGKAASPPLNKEQVREWRRTREENLMEGKEHMMLSLTLALPVGGIGERLGNMFGRRGQGGVEQQLGGEEEAGVHSA